ncbi:MAG: hypothetical protein D3X82_08155 [Candidatus Leucobacter sulfamidivorax]|nr:hypothetical protein [Candidatus Leucobacter sulfamidivorax]
MRRGRGTRTWVLLVVRCRYDPDTCGCVPARVRRSSQRFQSAV